MSVVWWFERSDVRLTEPVSDVTVAGAAMVLATAVEAMDTSEGMEVDKIVGQISALLECKGVDKVHIMEVFFGRPA